MNITCALPNRATAKRGHAMSQVVEQAAIEAIIGQGHTTFGE
jgi:hypothetical protein